MSRGRNAGNRGQGSKWIRKERRRRIYLRDGYACVWCGTQAIANHEVRLTLDHVIPRSRDGGNHSSNLVTACAACNVARGDMSAGEFAATLAQTRAVPLDSWRTSALAILTRVLTAACTELPPLPEAPRP